MAILMRRGMESEFDASKLLPGEFAVVTDGNKVYVAFRTNEVEELALKKEITGATPEQIKEAVDEYLSENPVTGGATKEQIEQIVNEALNEAKESGEFDGEPGPIGPPGPVGANGSSVYITSINESTDDSGNNIVTFSDGTKLTIKNGSKGETGETGPKGDDGPKGDTGPEGPAGSDANVTKANITNALGYTPAKQTDVTELNEKIVQQQAQINDLPNNETLIDNVVEKVPLVKSAEAPLFVTSEDDMVDSEKIYVYNGYVYQYGKTTKEVVTEGETITVPAQAVVYQGYRYSQSGGAFKDASGTASTVIVPLPKEGVSSAVVKITGMSKCNSYNSCYGGSSPTAFPSTIQDSSPWGSTQDTVTVPNGGHTLNGISYIAFFVNSTGANGEYNGATITLNGKAVNLIIGEPSQAKQESTTTTEGSTEIIEIEGFFNTGCAFAPADYEDRIIELEQTVVDLEKQIGTVDENAIVHNAIGTIFPPSQKPADSDFDGYDLDIYNCKAEDVFAYIDEVVSNKETVTKEILGKDESGQYDIARYTYAKREHIAWYKVNYQKMYAWKNGTTVIYSTSISPRIGDAMYSTPYIGTSKGTVTAVNATNRSRTVNSLEYVRYENGDVNPTVIYTDADDERNSNTSITKDGAVYKRYPLGDLGANRKPLIPIFIYANEHGNPKEIDYAPPAGDGHEGTMPAVVASRFLRDLASDKQKENPLYKFIRENCMVIVIPVANPYGFNYHLTDDVNVHKEGYYNANGVNINRNYDTPGWDVMNEAGNDGATMGAYAGSENETQYNMNTMMESGAVVVMALHGMWGWQGYVAHQGQNPDGNGGYVDYDQDKLAKVSSFLQKNWGYTLKYYDMSNGVPVPCKNTPDVTSKSPSYISQCGAYGGIVEFTEDDVRSSEFKIEHNGYPNENAYAQMLNLMAMWLSDYLENA